MRTCEKLSLILARAQPWANGGRWWCPDHDRQYANSQEELSPEQPRLFSKLGVGWGLPYSGAKAKEEEHRVVPALKKAHMITGHRRNPDCEGMYPYSEEPHNRVWKYLSIISLICSWSRICSSHFMRRGHTENQYMWLFIVLIAKVMDWPWKISGRAFSGGRRVGKGESKFYGHTEMGALGTSRKDQSILHFFIDLTEHISSWELELNYIAHYNFYVIHVIVY